jgi:hypothetical protein
VKDTPPEIERKFRKMLLKRSDEERLKMGCSMHATAQALAKAWISRQHPSARPAELKRLLFLHFYGNDFEPEQRKRIASALSKNRRPAGVLELGKSTTHKPPYPKVAATLKTSGAGHRLGKRRGLWSKGKDQN